MNNLPQDQMQTTEGSPYTDEIELLHSELIGRTPVLEEILASPVQSRLLARMTHAIDDNAAFKLLESLLNGMQFAIDVRTFAIAISWPQYCKM